MPRVCPHCRLVNPPTAERCDCGYDFAERRVTGRPDPAGGSGPEWAISLGCALMFLGGLLGVPGGLCLQILLPAPGTHRSSEGVFLVAGVFGPLVGIVVGGLVAAWVVSRRRAG